MFLKCWKEGLSKKLLMKEFNSQISFSTPHGCNRYSSMKQKCSLDMMKQVVKRNRHSSGMGESFSMKVGVLSEIICWPMRTLTSTPLAPGVRPIPPTSQQAGDEGALPYKMHEHEREDWKYIDLGFLTKRPSQVILQWSPQSTSPNALCTELPTSFSLT